MTTKHTSGPYRLVKRSNQMGVRSLVIDTGRQSGGVWCQLDHYKPITPEIEATAAIFAAAPDLVEALQRSTMDLEAIRDHNRKPGNQMTMTEAMLRGIECHIESNRAALKQAGVTEGGE